MLYSCSAGDTGGGGPSPRRARTGGRLGVTVDIHCHAHSFATDALVQAEFDPSKEPLLKFATKETLQANKASFEAIRPQLVSADVRLKDMDALGVDVQVISPSPFQYYYWASPELGRAAARDVNDWIAGMVATTPDRFVGLATIPLQAPELAVAEMERAVRELGMRGIEIGANVAGEELSDEKFRPVFAKAEELGILIFIHPNGLPEGKRLGDHYFTNLLGIPFDSSVAVSHLIFGGVLDRYPKLKICIGHGGGFVGAYSGRLDHAHAARPDCRLCISRPPSSYLSSLYFDTLVHKKHQLQYLIEEYGHEHLLLGSDYPYDMGEPDPVGFLDALDLDSERAAAIAGGNALRLLGLDPAKFRARVP